MQGVCNCLIIAAANGSMLMCSEHMFSQSDRSPDGQTWFWHIANNLQDLFRSIKRIRQRKKLETCYSILEDTEYGCAKLR